MSPWWIVCKKELRETLRDRRTLLVMILVPVLLYPVILVASEQLILFGQRNLEAEAAAVGVVGEPPDRLLELVRDRDELDLVDLSGDPEEAIRGDSVAAVAIVGGAADLRASRERGGLFDRPA